MHAAEGDAMERRARAQRYTGPSAGRIANRIPHPVAFERGWFRTATAICHGGDDPDGLAFRQRPDGNGIEGRCHGGCPPARVATVLEGVIGLPVWTGDEPITETEVPAPRRRWPGRKPVLVGGTALLLTAPLLLGHSLETTLANGAALGVAGVLLAGLPGRARRAFRP